MNGRCFSLVRALGAIAALIALYSAPASAQDYPTRPIRILVPYAPGGIADIAARIVGAKLTEAWGQQVLVENRPGGNGFIAMEATARAAPDGYTLVLCTVGDVAINPALFKDIPYVVDRDFAPIASVSDAPMVLATNGKSPYKTVGDVIAAAKAQPGVLNVATPGYGSINQLVLESIALNTGTKFVHVPYKGGAPAAQALVAAIFSSVFWQAQASRRTYRAAKSAFWRQRPASVRRSIRNGQLWRKRALATLARRTGPRSLLPGTPRSRSSTNYRPRLWRSSICRM